MEVLIGGKEVDGADNCRHRGQQTGSTEGMRPGLIH